MVKNPITDAEYTGDLGSITGQEDPLGERNGNPL